MQNGLKIKLLEFLEEIGNYSEAIKILKLKYKYEWKGDISEVENVIEFAVKSNRKSFISHPYCQIYFDSLWHKPEYDNKLGFLTTPQMKFSINYMFYVAFIVLLSYISVSKFTFFISPMEFILFIWIIGFIAEDILIYKQNKKIYFTIFTTYVNITTVLLLIFVIILRIIAVIIEDTKSDYASHAILIFATIICYVKLSFFFLLGPILFAVVSMLKDIVKFIPILLLFILAFTWAFMGITHETFSDDTWQTMYPEGPVLLSIWSIFGDFAEGITILNKSPFVGPVLLAIYLIFVNIFLINLLIAIMNDSYSRFRAHGDVDWKFYRYGVIKKYKSASILPPPISLFVIIAKRIKFYYKNREEDAESEPEVEEDTEVLLEKLKGYLNQHTKESKHLDKKRFSIQF